jgi:Leucine-rich repeat (LRR) protein
MKKINLLDLKNNLITQEEINKIRKITIHISNNTYGDIINIDELDILDKLTNIEDLVVFRTNNIYYSQTLEKICDLAISKNLKNLSLIGLGINKLSENIYNLQNLESLDLRHNDISHIDKNILKLKNLKELILVGNDIKIIPDYISNIII